MHILHPFNHFFLTDKKYYRESVGRSTIDTYMYVIKTELIEALSRNQGIETV